MVSVRALRRRRNKRLSICLGRWCSAAFADRRAWAQDSSKRPTFDVIAKLLASVVSGRKKSQEQEERCACSQYLKEQSRLNSGQNQRNALYVTEAHGVVLLGIIVSAGAVPPGRSSTRRPKRSTVRREGVHEIKIRN